MEKVCKVTNTMIDSELVVILLLLNVEFSLHYITCINFSLYLTEHLPRLIDMNREDILSAKERFGQMRRKPTVSNSRSYEGLSVRERKLEKAKNLGVRLVPTFVAPSPPIDPIRRSVHHKKTASSSSITGDMGANYTDRSTPEASMQLEEVSLSSRDSESYQRSHVASNIPTPIRSGPSSSGATNRSQRGSSHSSVAVRTSYSTGALSQASVQYGQEGAQLDSHHRSEVDTGSSSASAAAGVSQRQDIQRGSDQNENTKESSSPKVAAKATKSSRLGVFSRSKNVKKVTSHYEEILAQASKEKEKTTSRFRIKLPFGKGRVKELKEKIEPRAEKAEPPKRPSPPKLAAKQSPSVSPKHYFPPPKEPAPPPPREPAPPPPKGESNVATYNQGTVSSRPPAESNIPTYRRGPVSNKSSVESSIPVPSYHRGINDISPTGANVPSFYRRTPQSASKPMATESHIPSYHRKPPPSSSDSNLPSYQQRVPPPNKQYSPKHEDQSPASKLPPPAPKTYYRQLPPRTPQATPAEAAVVNSRMSLYKVQPYLVPIRTQPPPEVVFIPGPPNEEEHPPSESVDKVAPPPQLESTTTTQTPAAQQISTSSNTSSTQQTADSKLAATSSISKSNMSLDSVIEEYAAGTSPSPSASQPSSETASSSPKVKERRPSFVIPNSTLEPAMYRQLEPPSSKAQTSNQTSTYTSKPTQQSSSRQTRTFASKLPTYQSSTYTSKLPTPTSGSKPMYQSSTFSKKSTSAAATKPPPVSGSSMSLDSILTDMENAKKSSTTSSSNSTFRSQLPSDMTTTSSSKREDRSSPSKVASSEPTSSLTNRSFSTEAAGVGSSSMSLDSILDEFLKMSGTGDSSGSDQTGVTQKPQLLTKEEDKRMSVASNHQELKEKKEKKAPTSEVQDRPSIESAPNVHQFDESKNSRQSHEFRRQESLLSQGSTSTSYQEMKSKVGASGSSRLTLRSRQLQIRKERINFDSAPASGQLQSNKDKTELNSNKPIPRAQKLSRQEEQTLAGLESATHNGQPRVKDGGNPPPQMIPEPKQLQRREELQSNPDLTSSVPTMSMSQNLVKLKARANSAGTILDEEPEYSDPKDARRPSNTSNLPNGRTSPTPKV